MLLLLKCSTVKRPLSAIIASSARMALSKNIPDPNLIWRTIQEQVRLAMGFKTV
jgi:hypothetical protein